MKHVTLYDFQAEDVRAIHHEFDGRILNANAVGLGKTVETLYYSWKYLPEDPPGPIVVVVPSYLLINWEREARKHLGMRVELLRGERVPSGYGRPWNPNQLYVVSYRCLVPAGWRGRRQLPEDSWARWLLDLKPRLLISDEGHYLKSRYSQRTVAFRVMSRQVERVQILTGTPLTNSPKDLWSISNILWPKLFPSEFDFLSRYTFAKKRFFGWEFKGAQRLDELHLILKKAGMIRRRKEDVLKDLPILTHSVIPLEVDLKEYHEMEADFLGWLDKKAPGMSRSAAQAEELVKMNYLRQQAGLLKVEQIAEWTKDLLEETGGKLLLGSIHHAFSDALKKRLGRSCIQADGRQSPQEKQGAFDAFNTDPKVRTLIGGLQSAGTGWSCRSTSDVAVAELPWVPSDLAQFSGRVDGIERGIPGTAAHVRYFAAENTIDGDLCRVLQSKSLWADEAIDGGSITQGLEIYSQVKAAIRERAEARLGSKSRSKARSRRSP